ncbi:hypothetical protein DPMN_069580 [Dreissena polymorpha]|uniref:Uncharacterized protein n=1 Tax=Dreissena polymorpha TaxID=45954 RepID=A0A9D3YZS7_DREPO|nr:hypothetical protein DPMN_069580 [Dreissena polymorpha]
MSPKREGGMYASLSHSVEQTLYRHSFFPAAIRLLKRLSVVVTTEQFLDSFNAV